MTDKKHHVEIPLTEAQKAFLDELGGNIAKHFRDAIRAVSSTKRLSEKIRQRPMKRALCAHKSTSF